MEIDYLANHPEHVEELAALHFAEWNYLHTDDTMEKRIARLRKVCTKGGIPTMVIAIEGGELVGSGALVVSDMETRPELTPWLASIYVKTTFRKRGIGSNLVRRVEQEAKSSGVDILYLYTPSEAPLYASLGWSILEQCLYQETEVTVMQKDL